MFHYILLTEVCQQQNVMILFISSLSFFYNQSYFFPINNIKLLSIRPKKYPLSVNALVQKISEALFILKQRLSILNVDEQNIGI